MIASSQFEEDPRRCTRALMKLPAQSFSLFEVKQLLQDQEKESVRTTTIKPTLSMLISVRAKFFFTRKTFHDSNLRVLYEIIYESTMYEERIRL